VIQASAIASDQCASSTRCCTQRPPYAASGPSDGERSLPTVSISRPRKGRGRGSDHVLPSQPGTAPYAAFTAAPANYANPATIRNSTLLFPAISKNAPCSLSRENSLQHLETITKFDKNASALPAISENHPAKSQLQGDAPGETGSLLTASSATQSVYISPNGERTSELSPMLPRPGSCYSAPKICSSLLGTVWRGRRLTSIEHRT
jgi:hypothetical protein